MNLESLRKEAVRSTQKTTFLSTSDLRRAAGRGPGPSSAEPPICPEPTCPIHDWYPVDGAV